MKKFDILNKMHENFLFAVIRGKSATQAYEVSKAAYEGGFKNIEVTFTTPNADQTIRQLSEEFQGTDMVVGAGTVMDAATARLAIIAGAEFIVSPNLVPEIAEMSNLYGVPYLPGTATATEVAKALALGCDVVKIFPGGILGPKFIKDIHGPMPHVEMMPSGGVSVDNMDEWIEQGAWAVGVGSALTAGLEDNHTDVVVENAKKFSTKISNVKTKVDKEEK